jgi:hypothetical protein
VEVLELQSAVETAPVAPFVALTPEARRKPTIGGLTVKMADGLNWILARPRVLWVADDTEDECHPTYDLGPDYASLVGRYDEADNRVSQFKMVVMLAKYLLRLNYDLSNGDFAPLLVLDFAVVPEGGAETDAQQRAREIEELICGRIPAPKALAGSAG